MKKVVLFLGIITMAIFTFSACSSDNELNEISTEAGLKSDTIDPWVYVFKNAWYYSIEDVQLDPCGEVSQYPFFESALVTIANDEEFLYVKVAPEEGWSIREMSVAVWAEGDTPHTEYRDFPYRKSFASVEYPEHLTYKIPVEEAWGDCFKLSIKIMNYNGESYDWYWLTTDNTKSENYVLDYCWQSCKECPPVKVGDIIAGRFFDVGDLIVWEDADYLYIKYDVKEGIMLKEAHVYVGCIDEMPSTRKGTPKIGNFPYHTEDLDNGLLMIPLADIANICKDENGCIPIAAHAVVAKKMRRYYWEQTAWSTGTEFQCRRWGWYSTYCPCE